jgi:hypothetical protein
MEDGRILVYVVIAAFWLVSQLSTYLKRQQREKATAQVPPPLPRAASRRPASAPRPVVPAGASAVDKRARGIVESLDRFESRLATGLPELDERVRAQVMALVKTGYREEAERVRRSIESAVSERNPIRLQTESANAQRLLGNYQGLLKTAGGLSAARRKPDSLGARLVADRLLDEIDAPLRDFARVALLELPEAPPAAVVLDPTPNDPLRSSPLAASTIFVPRSVTADPRTWSFVSQEIARYLSALAPGLDQEIWERLELRVTDAEIASSREAVAKLLFGSYRVRILGDAVGATLFGPSYARALAALYAEPQATSRVTIIYLNQDGTVYPEPPSHLRIHLVVAWLTQLGLGTEAEEVRRVWDEQHGYPSSFAFHGRMATIPADVVLDTTAGLMAALEELELQAFSSRTITALPGISDWSHHGRECSEATRRFLAGEPARGRARALIAAAIDAAIQAPDRFAAIRNALYRSVASVERFGAQAERASSRAGAPTSPKGALTFPLGRRELVEALILGEVLLEPRRPNRS